MNEQEQWWAGEAGDAYTARNRVDWRARIPFWHDIMKFTGARSVYEVGCGAGWNLSAIRDVAPNAGLHGCDVNEAAIRQCWAAGLSGSVQHTIFERDRPEIYELIFSAGALIHVASADLPKLMQDIIHTSAHYILAIEYESEQEEMIEYRGVKDRLWKRNYGKLYEDMGLKLLHTGEAKGFDRCAYWLFSKP